MDSLTGHKKGNEKTPVHGSTLSMGESICCLLQVWFSVVSTAQGCLALLSPQKVRWSPLDAEVFRLRNDVADFKWPCNYIEITREKQQRCKWLP